VLTSLTVLGLLTVVWIVSALAAPFAYVTNAQDRTVSVIDTATNTVTTTLSVGGFPWGVAISPDASRAYVANAFPDNTVSVIATATNTVTTTIAVGDFPEELAFTPNGASVYVSNSG
jgi:YVTN family beta-propeller protein